MQLISFNTSFIRKLVFFRLIKKKLSKREILNAFFVPLFIADLYLVEYFVNN
jgi:hypothetical protein